jgi:hypothetical protein
MQTNRRPTRTRSIIELFLPLNPSGWAGTRQLVPITSNNKEGA